MPVIQSKITRYVKKQENMLYYDEKKNQLIETNPELEEMWELTENIKTVFSVCSKSYIKTWKVF